MTTHTTIRVTNNLATGQTGIAHRTTHHKPTGGVGVNDGIFVHQFGRDNGLDHMLNQTLSNGFVGKLNAFKLVRMLGAHQYGVHTLGFAISVFDGHLALAVWIHPG